jgi:hypothetical protein
LLPWSAYFFDRPNVLCDEGSAVATFNFVDYVFSALVLFCFVVVGGSLFWFAYMRHWRAAFQSLLEMGMCVGAVILLPDY